MKKVVTDINVSGKKVLVRNDFNVPLKDGAITDDNRIVGALPTIQYLVDNNAKVILCSHLGKVKTEEDKASLSLQVVATRLSELLDRPVSFVNQTRGEVLENSIDKMNDGDILLFENTRFEPGETKNDSELSQYWANLVDVFVCDAFGTVHRAHASTVGVASLVKENAVGFLVEKELNYLQNCIDNPQKPFIAILGGSKVSDKIQVIEKLLDVADHILIGGGMAYTFLKSQGLEVGNSLVEEDRLQLAQDLLSKANGKLVLPVDSICADAFANDANLLVAESTEMPNGYMGLDIGPKTVDLFNSILKDAKTVVWNGPMGVFEMPTFAKGTIQVCEILANLDATTIIGGGDSAAAAINLGFKDSFSHISTGGGASLALLEGQKLPGIEVIQDK